ncbi:hypothetical protein ACQKWADRAFT_307191 [Trichoderma austrokoningii]
MGIKRMNLEPNPDLPKGPPRPSPTPTATDIISSITRSMATSTSTSSPTPTGKSHGFSISEGGNSGERILRGFFIGMAIGVFLSVVLCCWLPCLRRGQRTRLQRRNDNIRRRLVVLEDEAWVNQNWPQRRRWEIGQDERESYDGHEDVSHEDVSHEV